MEKLLPYYERELSFLRRLSHDFARRHPKVAGRLLLSGEACEDPHIERLIESFAFLAARIHRKLDDDYPEITDSLLQVIFPQYLRPFPSVSIAQFDCGAAAAQSTAVVRIPRGTLMDTRAIHGVPCRFASAYDVDIWPLQVRHAGHESAIDPALVRGAAAASCSSMLRIDLETLADSAAFDALVPGRLRLFLSGDASLVAVIREALFSHALGIWIAVDGARDNIFLPTDAISPVGFAAHESLLQPDARSHHAGQLLLEYFAFPEKFNFVDIALDALAGKLPAATRSLQLRIGLRHMPDQAAGHLLDRIGKENFLLGCTPVVNLFRRFAEPIRFTHTTVSYPVIVDSRRPQAYEVYEIRRVAMLRQTPDGEQASEFKPLYSMRHGDAPDEAGCYWHASYIEDGDDSDYTMELSLLDANLDPGQPGSASLSIDLLCTNRDLPSQLPFGLLDGDLFIEGGSIAKTIRLLRKPSRGFRFPRGHGAQWRLVSQLSLNHLSLVGEGAAALREILALHDVARAPANGRQIAGIVAIDSIPATARIAGNPFPVFVRGLEIRVTLDDTHYAGIGLFMFAQVLDHFFGNYVHMNSFTRLVIVSRQTGQELLRCPARSGESILA